MTTGDKHFIHSFLHELNQTSRLCRLFGENKFSEVCNVDLTFEEFIILDTIACNEGICQSDLASLLLKGKSHISKLLSKLFSKGYINRPLDTKGNRIVRKITFTPEGEKVYYDLQGRQVQHPKNGLYIINGKKAVVRHLGIIE